MLPDNYEEGDLNDKVNLTGIDLSHLRPTFAKQLSTYSFYDEEIFSDKQSFIEKEEIASDDDADSSEYCDNSDDGVMAVLGQNPQEPQKVNATASGESKNHRCRLSESKETRQ
jgi:hypothetical protein